MSYLAVLYVQLIIKTFGFIFKAEMFNFWREILVIFDRAEINITDYPPVND